MECGSGRLVVSRWHCMHTSICRSGVDAPGFTMAARMASSSAPAVWRRDVVAAGSVAALAIDAFGQARRIERLAARLVVAGGNLRVGVVAEHALVGDGARRQDVIAVVSGAHGPGAAVFGIPGRAGARSARRARCGADKCGRGCRSPSRSRCAIPAHRFPGRRSRYASGAGNSCRRAAPWHTRCPSLMKERIAARVILRRICGSGR